MVGGFFETPVTRINTEFEVNQKIPPPAKPVPLPLGKGGSLTHLISFSNSPTNQNLMFINKRINRCFIFNDIRKSLHRNKVDIVAVIVINL